MIAFYAPQLQRMPPKPRQMTLLPKFAAVLVTSSTPMCSIFNSVASCNNAFAFRYICCPRISGKIRPRTSFSRGVCLACVSLQEADQTKRDPHSIHRLLVSVVLWNLRWIADGQNGEAGARGGRARVLKPGVEDHRVSLCSFRHVDVLITQCSSPRPPSVSSPHFSSICLCATMVRPSDRRVVLGDRTMLDRRHVHVQL